MPPLSPPRAHRLCAAVSLALGGLLSLSYAQAGGVMQLSSLDGSNGFRLEGVAAGDASGFAVAAAGDINGDGIDDLIVGAHGADTNGADSGSSYVVFGRSMEGFASTINLSTLDGSTGFRLDGAAPLDGSGLAVSAAGDINGDGIDDLIVGARGADANGTDSGSSYVLFGRRSSFASVINLSSFNGSNGFRLDGVAAGDRSGLAVSAAGDINGDQVDDLIIGAHAADPNGEDSGSSYVVFGRSNGGFASVLNLSSLDGSNGVRLDGVAANDNSGFSVSAAGDINADGVGDLIIGAPLAFRDGFASSSSYVVFGRSASGFDPVIALSSLDGSSGFRLDGVDASDRSGIAVSAAGDINGDGIDDLLIGAYRAGISGHQTGASYVVFGRNVGGFASAINLSTLDGSNGFRLDGVAAFDFSGRAVSAAGDINGDGTDDLIIGAFSADPNGSNSGSSYVVYGRAANGFASAFSLSTLDGSNGFRLDGAAAGDYSGIAVSAAGDINGDGVDDLIVGASSADANGADSGSSYVVFGTARFFADGFEVGG